MAMNRDSQKPVLNRWELEALMEHQERMKEIRMEIKKRKVHKRRVKAAKKAMKEFLVCTGAAIAMSAGLFCAFLFDPYQPPEPCLLYTSPSPRDGLLSRMPSSA